ncbi:MAG: AAA family ATPase [Candidatus Binatia bacterium]
MSSGLRNTHLTRAVFVGREWEMDILRAALEEVSAGYGRAVLLLGEPGIGKTRLATELIPYAQARGIRILIGRCPDSDGAPPYWPWMQLIRTYVNESDVQQLRTEMGVGAADLAQVIPLIHERLPDLPLPPRLEPEQERFRFFDSLTTFLKNATKRQPLLLFLDDLQWADASSLLFLQFLARELTDMQLFLVITCREGEVVQRPLLTQTLAAIARAAGSQTLRLRGLAAGEVARFIELTTGQASPTTVSTAVFQRTEGHPFFMTEVVHLLAARQDAATRDAPSPPLLVLPPTVRSVIEQRLQTVSPACRRMLAAAAVHGREFRLQVLEVVVAQGDGSSANPALFVEADRREDGGHILSVLVLLDEALAARLIVATPQNAGCYSFTHALIQETLYEGIATSERLGLHRRIGEALEMITGDYVTPHLSELAHHFFQAAQSGRDVDKAIAYATRAAERATTMLAYEEALAHYERALQVLWGKESDEELRCDLLLALGKAQERAGDLAAAQQQFQQAAELAGGRQFSRQLALAALGLAGTRIPISGPNPSILQILQDALALLPQDASALRAQLLARLAKELTYSDTHKQREQYSYEAIKLARLTADPHSLGATLYDHCIATWRPDTLHERIALSVEITTLAEQVGDPELVLYNHFLRIANALEQGDILTVEAAAASFTRYMAEIRPPISTWGWFHERLPTMRALLAGRFREAEEQLLSPSASLHHAPDTRDGDRMILPQFLILRREQGRLQEPGLETMLQYAVEQYPALSALRCALAYVRSELGREVEARVEFEYWAAHNFALVPHRQDRLATFVYLVEMCAAWGDTIRAAQLYELLLPYKERNVVIGTAVGYLDAVAHLLGNLATVIGRSEEACAHFEFALQRNLHMGARPRLAHTQYSYAGMLLARNQPGDQEQAAMLLAQALATAQELGMEGLEEKVKNQEPKIKNQNDQEARDWGLETRLSSPQVPTPKPQASSFRRDGEYWTVRFENVECRLKDSRGLHYLSRLLLHPHREFSALDLVNLGAEPPDIPSPQRTAALGIEHASVTTGGDAGELLDPQAKAAYQRRLQELREELEEAKEFNDIGRVEKLEEEREFLLRELSRAVGLGGRRRKAGSAAERARLNVTVTLKSTIARITKHHRALGHHLAQTIKTGAFCSYAPSPALAVEWHAE